MDTYTRGVGVDGNVGEVGPVNAVFRDVFFFGASHSLVARCYIQLGVIGRYALQIPSIREGGMRLSQGQVRRMSRMMGGPGRVRGMELGEHFTHLIMYMKICKHIHWLH